MRPALDAAAGWIDITVAGLVVRLRNLVDIMQDCQLLREAIAEDRNPDLLKLAFMPDTLTFAVPHRDHGLALLSAASVALSILACCAFSIATGWPDGVIAPLFAAVVGSILAGVDDPLPPSAVSTGYSSSSSPSMESTCSGYCHGSRPLRC